mgnify:CR=1 FL=1
MLLRSYYLIIKKQKERSPCLKDRVLPHINMIEINDDFETSVKEMILNMYLKGQIAKQRAKHNQTKDIWSYLGVEEARCIFIIL